MEKVTDLFKAFRNNEIDYEALFGSLTKMLSEDPRFANQAISTLDNAQQLTPIPVTDFIQLRSQLENTAETFQQQGAAGTPADGEATKIFDVSEATQRPAAGKAGSGDATLVSAPAPEADFQPRDNGGPQAAPQASSEPDYQDEATVIMPMPPRQPAAERPTAEATPPAIPLDQDDQATLIATPITNPAPEPSPAPQPAPAAESQPAPAKPTGRPRQQDKKPPVMLLAGAGGLVLIVILALVLWPGGEEQPKVASPETQSQEPANSPWQSRPAEPEVAAEPEPTPETFANPAFGEPEPSEVAPAVSESSIDLGTSGETAAETDSTAFPTETTEADTEFFDASNSLPQESTASSEQPTEPAVKDEAYFMNQIKAAVAADKLTPAEQQGTATFYLVELIRLDKHSEQISEARTLISKRHLELAKTARENSDWDGAQQHLDDALKVRLPDSYLP